jgi:ankyrin repeat protein
MIFDAIRQGDTEQVRSLLAANPSLASTRNSQGATPLLWAAYTRHPEMTPILLAVREPDFFESCAIGQVPKADSVNEFAPDGFTGLGLACFFGHLETARRLLDQGADPNLASRNSLLVAPLHSAVAADSPGLVKLLLARGAVADPAESSGFTPLHTAAGHGNREVIAMLVDAGADRSRKNREGKTPSDIARQYGHTEVAAELET